MTPRTKPPESAERSKAGQGPPGAWAARFFDHPEQAPGQVTELAEDHDQVLPGCLQTNPVAGGNVETIIAEIHCRLAVTDEAEPEMVREACEDAVEG